LPGCKTDVEQVIGNAVPVKLAEYVAKQLISHIQANPNVVRYSTQLFQERAKYEVKRTSKKVKVSKLV
jgi:hypothetical protein